MLSLVYSLLGLFALSAVALAVYSARRASRCGNGPSFDEQARMIFDDLEPEGTTTDFFPGKGPPPSEYLL